MSVNQYTKGGLLRITYDCLNENNENVDPTTLTIKIRPPAPAAQVNYVYNTDPEVVKVSTGKFKIEVNLNKSGVWHHRVETTGTGQAALEGTFVVKQTVFT